MPRLNYLVVGVGAIGGVFGAKLLAADCNVCFLARSNFHVLSENGIAFFNGDDCSQEKATYHDIRIVNSVDSLSEIDVVVLAAKVYDNERILNLLKKVITPRTIILTLQNGIGIEYQIGRKYPDTSIFPTVTWIKASYAPESNKFTHHFGHQLFSIGYHGKTQAYFKQLSNDVGRKMFLDLQRAGFDVTQGDEFFINLWTKLTLNLPLFILTIKYDLSSDEILKSSEYADELEALRGELIAVAKAMSVDVDVEFIIKTEGLLRSSKQKTYPSMKNDFDQGKELELDANFDHVFKCAKLNDIKVPNLESGYKFIKSLVHLRSML
ncbi:MAG: 2-dehydropantoate 2-reductase [Legionellales bacterium]|nr:2-dehydropantoate 2-reductase [Legionellales bacterium]